MEEKLPFELIKECFEDAIMQAITAQPPEVVKRIEIFNANLLRQFQPWSIVAPRALPDLTEFVFRDTVAREYVWNLTAQFFVRWMPDPEEYDRLLLALSLGTGADIVPEKTENFITTPSVIADSFVDPDAIFKVLKQNKWMVTLLLIQMYHKVSEEDFQKYLKELEPAANA